MIEARRRYLMKYMFIAQFQMFHMEQFADGKRYLILCQTPLEVHPNQENQSAKYIRNAEIVQIPYEDYTLFYEWLIFSLSSVNYIP
jgi:hypothetical protein